MPKKKVLIVDDELHTREALMRYLRIRFEVKGAEDGAAAIDILKHEDFDLVLTDLRMPGADGMGVLEAALSKARRPVCIVFTAYGTIENAVAAVKAGAFDFVTKPVKLDKLDEVIAKALAGKNTGENSAGRQTDATTAPPIGDSDAMRRVMELVNSVAPSKINVLLTGESGTGKEVIARAIHDASGRHGLFVPVHCAALPANLLESELFGHEKGAFTGAASARKGRFELADGGTIFLDEIGEIEPAIQIKLLRVLESRTIERIGGNEQIKCDARLIAATNRDLTAMVREGTFREDLYYRLEGITIKLPPLRERRGDIPLLLAAFVAAAATDNNRANPVITPDALNMLTAYSWPGNIRELRHCAERMVVLCRDNRIEVADVPENIRDNAPLLAPVAPDSPPPDGASLEQNERELIMRALVRCGGNRTKAAEELGISRRTLHRRLHEYGLNNGE